MSHNVIWKLISNVVLVYPFLRHVEATIWFSFICWPIAEERLASQHRSVIG